jgi:hypothetical protein
MGNSRVASQEDVKKINLVTKQARKNLIAFLRWLFGTVNALKTTHTLKEYLVAQDLSSSISARMVLTQKKRGLLFVILQMELSHDVEDFNFPNELFFCERPGIGISTYMLFAGFVIQLCAAASACNAIQLVLLRFYYLFCRKKYMLIYIL